jgi:hypothetical protein
MIFSSFSFFVFLFFDIFISGISTQETEAQEISAQTEVSCGLQKFGKFLRQLGQNLKLLAGGLNYFFEFFENSNLMLSGWAQSEIESRIYCKNLSSNGAPSEKLCLFY